MKQLINLTKRNVKIYFSDKTMFFTSLITPIILLVLYATFLADNYKNMFLEAISGNFILSGQLVNAFVGGQLISSVLAVSCVTVAFTSNFIMAQDKVNHAIKDIHITPTKTYIIGASYFLAAFISTIMVIGAVLSIGFIYMAFKGWYMNFYDVMCMVLDVFLLTIFGVALSSVINFKLSTQGQISAVGTIVSAGYGFLCGAYMPLSYFNATLQKILSFLPGTYATSLIRNHALKGPFREMANQNIPLDIIEELKNALDCHLTFFHHEISLTAMYIYLILSIVFLIALFALMNIFQKKK